MLKSFFHCLVRDLAYRLICFDYQCEIIRGMALAVPVLCLLLLADLNPTSSKDCDADACSLGDWTDWSPCSRSCGEDGQTVRTRELLSPDSCPEDCRGDLEDTESCNQRCCPQNCKYSEWGTWECSCSQEGTCHNESASPREVCYRYREKIAQQSCGGYCDEALTDTKCGSLCCYLDCVLGPWSNWGQCTALCEQEGVRNRTRVVTQEARCGGKACPEEDLYQEEVCMGPCCRKDCLVEQWASWGPCDNSCGSGRQNRTRVVQQGECGGRYCPPQVHVVEDRPCEEYISTDCEVGIELR